MAKKQTYLEGLGVDLSNREFFQPSGKAKTIRVKDVEIVNEEKDLPDGGKIKVLARLVVDELRVGIWMEGLEWEISSKRALQALNPVLEGPGTVLSVRKSGTGKDTMYVIKPADDAEA